MRELTNSQEDALIESALNAACAVIQAGIGQTHGDVAAHFFTGKNLELFKSLMQSYIDEENASSADE